MGSRSVVLFLVSAIWVALGLMAGGARSAVADAAISEDLKSQWLDELNNREFVAPDLRALERSLERCTFDGFELRISVEPGSTPRVTFAIFKDGRHVFDFPAHLRSSFVSSGQFLYLADFSPGGAGCKVIAYNLTSGKAIWETKLHQEVPLGYSAYSNRVDIRLSDENEIDGAEDGAAIIICGSESYCDYVEVLDRASGESLAVKNYRVGYRRAAGRQARSKPTKVPPEE